MQEYIYYKTEQEDRVEKKVVFKLLAFVVLLASLFIVLHLGFMEGKYTYITVNGTSMQNTINANPITNRYGKEVQDGVFVEYTQNINYNDIIIIDKTEYTVIKRVIALENDLVSIIKVDVDGEEEFRVLRVKNGSENIETLQENYILSYESWNKRTTNTDGGVVYESSFYSTFITGSTSYVEMEYGGQTVKFAKIKKNQVFYLGDNRAVSSDSRQNGTSSMDDVIGKVVYIAHDASSYKNSILWLWNRVKGYFSVLSNEICEYFCFKV